MVTRMPISAVDGFILISTVYDCPSNLAVTWAFGHDLAPSLKGFTVTTSPSLNIGRFCCSTWLRHIGALLIGSFQCQAGLSLALGGLV